MTRTLTAEPVLDAHADVGEGPAWDVEHGRLIWVDITASTVHLYDPAAASDRTHHVGQHVGAAVPSKGGDILLAVRDGLASLAADGSVRTLAMVESDRPDNRMNDAKCDPQGRIWAGTMAYRNTPGAGALYRYDGREVSTVLSSVTMSNGLGWSPDGSRMYYIDSATQCVDAFDFDGEVGVIGSRRTVVEIDPAEGMPDGMTVDDDGCLWVALWGGGVVHRYTPDGRLDTKVRLPVSQPTSCAFGGPGQDVLYVTSAAYQLDRDALAGQPLAGALFAVDPATTGPAATPFASLAP